MTAIEAVLVLFHFPTNITKYYHREKGKVVKKGPFIIVCYYCFVVFIFVFFFLLYFVYFYFFIFFIFRIFPVVLTPADL